jgi:hypothetical protein
VRLPGLQGLGVVELGECSIRNFCPASLESLHGRREDSNSRSAREARGSKGGKAHAAKMTPEGRSKSARKAAKARWTKRRREESS